ncbi:MAG: site-specific recombinase [Actinomycetota bacterium]|nr:site-specific recombinase [Actinomycetota bacterium]
MQRSLRQQLKRLDGQEDSLVELVADGELPVEKLKARLRAAALQRDHLSERLARTDQELNRGSETIDLYLEMLSQPELLFNEAPDPVRRQLLEAFFPPFLSNIEDEVEIRGDAHVAVRALTAIEFASTDDAAEHEKGPRVSAGAQLITNLLVPFFDPMVRIRVPWLRGQDLNLRPLGYEPSELPNCSTPRHE